MRLLMILALASVWVKGADVDPVVLYKGTDPHPLDTFNQPGIPFISLMDFVNAMGYTMVSYDQIYRVKVFNREISFEPARQLVDLGWKTLPVQMRIVGETAYVRVDAVIKAFSEVIGKDLIYEPTSRTIHLPDDRDLQVTLRDRWNEGQLRLSVAFSKRVERPNLYRSGRYLILSVKYPHIEINRDRFTPNEAINEVSIFANLPDKTSEIHFKLGPTVTSYTAEPYVTTNSELIIKLMGEFEAVAVDELPFTDPFAENREPGVHRIVIDPGHGGKDVGARGPTGLQEKMLTLDLARKLKRRLEGKGYEVVLTRNDDFNLPLKVRTGVANNAKADLFISIHLNAIVRPDAWGSETYYLSLNEQDDFAENFTVEFENREDDDGVEDDDSAPESGLDLLLWDLAQSEHIEDSFRVARYIQEELNILAGIRNRGVKQAPLKVLKGATMPAVLIEVAFISNPKEERKLKDFEFKNKVVRAMGRAIERYDRDVRRRSTPQKAEMIGDRP